MARAFKAAGPFTVPMYLLIPTETTVQGAVKKTFPAIPEPEQTPTPAPNGAKAALNVDPDPPLIWGSFRTFGGTEAPRDGVYSIINTATIDTWWRPDITAACRIALAETGEVYEIIADPEDIDRRHQYMQLRVRRTGGPT